MKISRSIAFSLSTVLLLGSVAACSSKDSATATASASASGTQVAASGDATDAATQTSSPEASPVPPPSPPASAEAQDSSGSPGDAGYVPPEAEPVSIGEPSSANEAAQVSISLARVTATAAAPGDVTGPAVAVTVTVQAWAEGEVDLAAANVELRYSDAAVPGVRISSAEEDSSLPESVDAGATVTGTYVFSVPEEVSDVEVRVTTSVDSPVAVFTGAL